MNWIIVQYAVMLVLSICALALVKPWRLTTTKDVLVTICVLIPYLFSSSLVFVELIKPTTQLENLFFIIALVFLGVPFLAYLALKRTDPKMKGITFELMFEHFASFISLMGILFLVRNLDLLWASVTRFVSGNNFTWSGTANALFLLLLMMYIGFWVFGAPPIYTDEQMSGLSADELALQKIRGRVLAAIAAAMIGCWLISLLS